MQWFATHIVALYAIGAAAFALVGLRFLGIRALGAFGLRGPLFATPSSGIWDAAALGGGLAVAACPACTPILLAVVLGAVAIAQPLAGATLLAAFGIGRTVPIVALALSMSLFTKLRALRQFVTTFERTGGVLLIVSAIYLAYQAIATWAELHTGTALKMPGM